MRRKRNSTDAYAAQGCINKLLQVELKGNKSYYLYAQPHPAEKSAMNQPRALKKLCIPNI
jgi:hypothetical protein